MKTQHRHKLLGLKDAIFNTENIAGQLQSSTNVIELEDASFDTHWSYSYIMDYIWSHKKPKKRKS
ncbi:MAG TPA: hypothetical protein VKG26_04270 [Bacteroidia bacterium]|nr:hypothetical protein [Bacteroidia bacterium]